MEGTGGRKDPTHLPRNTNLEYCNRTVTDSPTQTLSFTENIWLALGLPSPLSQAGVTGGFPHPHSTSVGSGDRNRGLVYPANTPSSVLSLPSPSTSFFFEIGFFFSYLEL